MLYFYIILAQLIFTGFVGCCCLFVCVNSHLFTLCCKRNYQKCQVAKCSQASLTPDILLKPVLLPRAKSKHESKIFLISYTLRPTAQTNV